MARRVVWITASPPDHEGTGGQLRQAHLLDAAAARADVVLLCAGEVRDRRVRDGAARVVEVAPGPPLTGGPLQQGAIKLGRLASSRHPLDTARAGEVRRRLGEAARQVLRADDTVVVEHLELAPLLPRLAAPVARSVLTIHHAAAHQARQHRAIATNVWRRAWWAEQERRFRRLESWAGSAYDVVVTVSELDAASVACPSTVVANGADVAGTSPVARPDRDTVVMTGALDYWPNVDGARWLVEEVWPLVRQEVPTARLDVVGRRPHPDVLALSARPGVEVHGDVPEIRPWLDGADVCVVPLRLGGGTRLKALQAMAAARPVVGTRIGLEGLDLVAGRDALVADEPRRFARHVVTCLVDRRVADAVADAGHQWVVTHHDWRALGRRFAATVLGLEDQASSASTRA